MTSEELRSRTAADGTAERPPPHELGGEEPDDGLVADRPPEAQEERLYVASQWRLMWWRFRKHKLAVGGAMVVLMLYVVGAFAEFLAPVDPSQRHGEFQFTPPQRVHLIDRSDGLSVWPYVHGWTRERDPETLRWIYQPDPEVRLPLAFFVRGGEPYRMWGLFESDVRLFGLQDPDAGEMFLLGTDRLGRDMLSRIIHGTRISMTIGLVGVALSLTLGILLGGLSGYYGGTLDMLIQRAIEFFWSLPTIPVWMALAAVLPAHWSPARIYFGITVILSLIGWTTMARVVRGRFLSLREEDFVMAAKLSGTSELRIILRHMVPSFMSHIIAAVTLAIPFMILAETALSFLGLGLRPPIISWGVLLEEAQNVRSVAFAPWLLLPGAAVVIAVLAFNFMGDGLRDAADPYAK